MVVDLAMKMFALRNLLLHALNASARILRILFTSRCSKRKRGDTDRAAPVVKGDRFAAKTGVPTLEIGQTRPVSMSADQRPIAQE